MSARLTPWVDCATPPTLQGVYERQILAVEWIPIKRFQYWNGRYWCSYGGSPNEAAEQSHISSSYQGGSWRGLASKPKASKP